AAADPWGTQIDWKNATVRRLVDLLGDRRIAVQDRARLSLIDRGKTAVPALTATVEGKGEAAVKQHAVWALGGIADESALPPLRAALRAGEPDIVIPAARALAVRGDRSSTDQLCQLLTSPVPSVQLAAAEALAHCGDTKALPALWKALQGQPDR